MFDRPRTVDAPGHSTLMRRIASIVSIASRRRSSSPVESGTTTVAKRPATWAPAPSTRPGTDSAPLAIPADDAAAVGGIREHYADGIRAFAAAALPRTAVDVRAAGARDRAHARRRAVRRDVGAPLRGRRHVPLRRAHRPRAVRGAGVGRRRAPHRQGARFSIASVIFAIAALSIARHAVGARRLDLRAGRDRRRRVRGHAVAADVDAPRRDLARRAHERTRPGGLVQRRVDGRRDRRASRSARRRCRSSSRSPATSRRRPTRR